ncbi:hypothetical protein OR1_04151 [Geobacter sp. OR-1]|uniref:hypothetical protein n=1 Tax=Geobacter sp. OR-1 TaxID=1266765 RepID=UPI000541D994|nr:hypothetical protein [Geobacter sp. OR-1]GAM11833.1 hypothetical protein OR1_04151 [Geobacter sp. OR-1]
MDAERRDFLIQKMRESGVELDGVDVPDFDTWEGFGVLYQWASSQPWWEEFACEGYLDPISLAIFTRMIDREKFAQFLWEFL